nr:ABC transporter ATP-binding protein [Clostridia bacterium]
MKDGVVNQIGEPQSVYDDPTNLFVAKFLGTPPINVFSGRVSGGKLYIGDDCIMTLKNVPDQEVHVGIRPEGFILDDNGPLHCELSGVEVMGRDITIVSKNANAQAAAIRSIISADNRVDTSKQTVSFSLKPHKVHIFSKATEQRIRYELG